MIKSSRTKRQRAPQETCKRCRAIVPGDMLNEDDLCDCCQSQPALFDPTGSRVRTSDPT